MNELIKGSGGGKSGGGSARVAVEAPNTLNSVQYARVIDLVSEGEIEGLVNGLNSVYIDNTPLMDEQGKYNFSGVTIDYRTGTQSQEYIQGFPSVENEVNVGTEVTASLPVIRSITNTNVDAARVTISVPQLTSQNTQNGDLNGTTVNLQLHYRISTGPWIPAKINVISKNLSVANLSASSGESEILSAVINFKWVGEIKPTNTLQTCNWLIEYKSGSSGVWQDLQAGVFNGYTRVDVVYPFEGINYRQEIQSPPVQQQTVNFQASTPDTYEFRVTKISGDGQLSVNYATATTYTPDIIISGKTVSNYQRSVRVDLPQPGPWDIRVTRITPDSTQSSLQNKTYFSSFTEIIDAKLSYPNSAIFGIQIDARQFNSIPSRAFEIYGIKVKVPTNYNPKTREYSGEWDGNFQVAWTNNPAWIFYDLVTNNRYGLGDFIIPDAVDKWGLYSIGKYCDGLIPDGLGGYEPRFTCNAYIQTRYEAYNLLSQLASVFRAMIFWSQGQVTCVQDSPSLPVAQFTSANVIDGQFNYSGSSVKTRHTVCLVTWNDPKDRYQQKVEYVEDEEGIATYGVVQTEIQAFGCTSRGQAHRLGKWLLFSERLETETVNFKAGMDAALVYPGAVIKTQDQFRSGKRYGGRLLPGSTSTTLNLDSQVLIELGKTYEISVVMPTGEIFTSLITNTPGSYNNISLLSEMGTLPEDFAIWVLSASDLRPEEWRVVNISEESPGIVNITALYSNQSKYDSVEKDLVLEVPRTISIDLETPTITNLLAVEALYLVTPTVVGNSVTLSWTSNSPRFIVSYSSEGLNPIFVETTETSYTFNGVPIGEYTFSVQPINVFGKRGAISSIVKEIQGLKAPPSNVTGLNLNAIGGNAHITFNPSIDLDVKIGGYLKLKHSKESASWNDGIEFGVFIPGTASSVVVPLLEGNYLAKWVDSSGIESIDAAVIFTNYPDILKLNIAETIQEDPGFEGQKTNVGVSEFAGVPAIMLDSVLSIDSMLTNVDSFPYFDAWGGVSQNGEYLFSNTIDLGAIYTSRLSANIVSFGVNSQDQVDLWGLIDDLLMVDGDVISDVSATIFVKYSNNDIDYSEWLPLFVGDYSARFFKFKVLLNSGGSNNIVITKCSVIVDMPDTIYSGEDISSGLSTYSVVYPKPFYNSSAIGITAQDMGTGDYYIISNKTNFGFDITFKNSLGANINKTFDYISKGY